MNKVAVLAGVVLPTLLFRKTIFKAFFWSDSLRPLAIPLAKIFSARKQLKDQHKLLVNEAPYKGIHFRDMLLGVAIGDSFGAGIEMKSRSWILQNVKFDQYINARGNRSFSINYASGLYTDDTEMTIAIIKSLVSGQKITEELLISFFKSEFNDAVNWIGIPRQGHGSIKDHFLGFSSLDDIRNRQRKAVFPGNAPPMRAVPIGLVKNFDEMIRISIVNATSTHPHPKAVTASILTALASHYFLVTKGNPIDLIKYCLQELEKISSEYLDSETIENLRKIQELEDYHLLENTEIGRKGLNYELLCGNKDYGIKADAMHTVFCVLYILKFHRNPMETLKACIEIGGDVDSLASIVLGIVGGRFGLRIGEDLIGGLPVWLVEPLEGVLYLQNMAIKLRMWYDEQ